MVATAIWRIFAELNNPKCTLSNMNLTSMEVMYRSNQSFNIPPPGQPPGHLTFLKVIVQIPPYPGQNAVQMPHTWVHSGDQMAPPLGHFTATKMTYGWQKCLINMQIKLRNTVSVFTKNKSLMQSSRNRCYKVTECSAFLRVSCNIKSLLQKKSHLLRLLHHDHFTDMHHHSPY